MCVIAGVKRQVQVMKESALWNHKAIEKKTQWLCKGSDWFYSVYHIPCQLHSVQSNDYWKPWQLGESQPAMIGGVLPWVFELLQGSDKDDYIFCNIMLMKWVFKAFKITTLSAQTIMKILTWTELWLVEKLCFLELSSL